MSITRGTNVFWKNPLLQHLVSHFIIYILSFAAFFSQSFLIIFTINILLHSTWILGTGVGYYAESLLDVKKYGLDYALSAMFIALIILQTHHIRGVLVGLLSASCAVGFTLLGFEVPVCIRCAILYKVYFCPAEA